MAVGLSIQEEGISSAALLKRASGSAILNDGRPQGIELLSLRDLYKRVLEFVAKEMDRW